MALGSSEPSVWSGLLLVGVWACSMVKKPRNCTKGVSLCLTGNFPLFSLQNPSGSLPLMGKSEFHACCTRFSATQEPHPAKVLDPSPQKTPQAPATSPTPQGDNSGSPGPGMSFKQTQCNKKRKQQMLSHQPALL